MRILLKATFKPCTPISLCPFPTVQTVAHARMEVQLYGPRRLVPAQVGGAGDE